MAKYIGNGFSLAMLPAGATIEVAPVEAREVISAMMDCAQSIMGHQDVAALAAASLGLPPRDLPVNRASVALEQGDVLYVAQYLGPRLPEGCRELPAGARLEWRRVSVVETPEGLAQRERELEEDARRAARERDYEKARVRLLEDEIHQLKAQLPRHRVPGDDDAVRAQAGPYTVDQAERDRLAE